MKQEFFVKCNFELNKLTGSQGATAVLSALEYRFQKQPDGFFKFIEPCSHRLYKEGDSLSEELGVARKSIARAFKKIGIKYNSRTDFENASDKFQGKLYASYYERHTNLTFFVRNHDLADELLKKYSGDKNHNSQKEQVVSQNPLIANEKRPFGNGQYVTSYIEPKKTSSELSNDNSHASNEIEKKMIGIWVQVVEGGKKQIEITGRLIAFLRQAFKDKFDNCLEKWKAFCERVASSRFLMGEIKSSFRATLDWALKFEVIQKILEGNYGIGDRRPSTLPSPAESFVKNSKIEMASEEAVIENSLDEPEPVRKIRLKWLNKFGASTYRESLKDCTIEVEDHATLILRPSSRYNAKLIASYWTPTLLVASPFTKVHVVQQEGDLVFEKWFLLEPGRERTLPEDDDLEANVSSDLTAAPMAMPLPEATDVVEAVIEKSSEEPLPCEAKESGVVVIQVTLETQMLRKKLRESLPHNQFPTWLGSIEVEDVSRDATIVVALEDSFSVEWCRSRFSKEIFEAAASLWKGVNKLIIRQKEDDVVSLSVEKNPKKYENIEEKSTLEQAIQSFLSLCSPRAGTFGVKEACQAFG